MGLLSSRLTVPKGVAAGLALLGATLALVLTAYAQSEAATCTTGTAVPDPANNPGLVSDCEALLASRDTLAGTATLNWSADRPIAEWEGVVIEGVPEGVTRLVPFQSEYDG